MRIGVITVTFNSGRVLKPFFSSMAAQTHGDFLLYAIDNASSDSTIEQLNGWGDRRLRVISNAVNVGIAEADNQGISAALADGCDYVLFLNNDVEFEQETFATLVTELEMLGCDMVAPKIFFEDRIHIWSAGGTMALASLIMLSNIARLAPFSSHSFMPRLLTPALPEPS